MKEKKEFYTPADIFTEHGMRKVKKDYESVDLKLAIVNLVQTVDEQESEPTCNCRKLPFSPNCHCEAHEVSCGNHTPQLSLRA